MLRGLSPDRYYDEPYRHGAHVVLLALTGDPLTRAALRPFERVSKMTQSFSFWLVEIASTAQAEAIQAIRFPQYRFVQNGSETHQHVGVLEDEELIEAFDHLDW